MGYWLISVLRNLTPFPLSAGVALPAIDLAHASGAHTIIVGCLCSRQHLDVIQAVGEEAQRKLMEILGGSIIYSDGAGVPSIHSTDIDEEN